MGEITKATLTKASRFVISLIMEVVSVEVLVNPQRWDFYSTACSSLASEPTPIVDTKDIHTSAAWQASLMEQLPPSAVNETFLFHGTKPFLVDTILQSGLLNTISQHSG